MSTPPRSRIFLARVPYRRRRVRDVARVLPVLGAVLWSLPLLLRVGPQPASSAGVLLWVFGVWCLLILAAALLAGPLMRGERETGESPAGDGDP